jgi:beta-lactamase regulating signal transducer with metallopeptidase domain
MMQLFQLSSYDWSSLRIMLVYALWQGPLVLIVALFSEALVRRRPQAAFATSFGLLLLMPVLAFATYSGTFTTLPHGLVEFSSGQVPPEASAIPVSHSANVAVVASWAGLAALLIARSLLAEWYLRHRLLSRSIDLDGSWRQRFLALSTRACLKQNVRVVVSREEAVPLTFGWLRPVVVLPDALLSRASVDHVELLLLHELMHLRRKDYPMVLIQHFVRCLFFYSPAVWFLMKLINQRRELACDRDVLNLGVAPRSYAAALVAIEGLRQDAPGVSAAGGDLLGRVSAILNVRRPPSSLVRSRWPTAVGLAMVGFAAVACAGHDPRSTINDADAFRVDLFENAVARVNGVPVRDDTEIAVRASHADKNGRAFIGADDNVAVDRIIDVLESLKREGMTRVAFARVDRDDRKLPTEP